MPIRVVVGVTALGIIVNRVRWGVIWGKIGHQWSFCQFEPYPPAAFATILLLIEIT